MPKPDTKEVEQALAGLIHQIAQQMGVEKTTTLTISLCMTISHGFEGGLDDESESWKS